MVNAQKWLDEKYPKQSRDEVSWIETSWTDLEGSLKLEGFSKLERFYCYNKQLTKLEINDCPLLKEVVCYGNKLTNLDVNNCLQLKILHCSTNKLTNLDLSNCLELEDLNYAYNQVTNLNFNNLANLRKFNCSGNQLTSLNLVSLVNLEQLNCSNNLLTDIDLTSLDPKKIDKIDLSNNNFSNKDLTVFSHLINMKEISVENNSFSGSLEPLKNLKKLNVIKIKNTDIDSGLEYLPESVKEIFFGGSFSLPLSSSFGDLGCRKIYDQLEEYFPLGYSSITATEDLTEFNKGGVWYKEEPALRIWRVENVLNHREIKKKKLIEQNVNLQQITNWQNQLISLESELRELERVFGYQLKPQKNSLNNQIRNKRTEITNMLYSSKSSSSQLHKEIEESRKQLSKYEKLVKQLQEAKKLLQEIKSVTDETEIGELINSHEYLVNTYQELQKEDNTQVNKGSYQLLESIRERQEKIKRICEKVENKVGKQKFELEKNVDMTKKITQKLLDGQQLVQQEIPPK